MIYLDVFIEEATRLGNEMRYQTSHKTNDFKFQINVKLLC